MEAAMSEAFLNNTGSKWEREGSIVAGILVQEIGHAKTWQQIVEAGDALFHLRLMQRKMEPRPMSEGERAMPEQR